MILSFATSKLEKLANNSEALAKFVRKQKAPYTTNDVTMTIDMLRAADSSFDIPRSYRPHQLHGNLKGHIAVDINTANKHRIIFRPDHEDDSEFRIDNLKTIKRVVITHIGIDYH